jgi:hypothetical protein
MLNPIICPKCLQPNEPARKLCWKCMRELAIPPTEAHYLQLFNLTTSWSKDELKLSFIRLAKQYHPDANPGNREADAHFKYVNQAYEALSRIANSAPAEGTKRPEPAPTPGPAAAPRGKEASMEMASRELYEKLREVVDEHRANQNRPKPLSPLQKVVKWFHWLITGKE